MDELNRFDNHDDDDDDDHNDYDSSKINKDRFFSGLKFRPFRFV